MADFRRLCVKSLVHTAVWTAFCALTRQKSAHFKILRPQRNGFVGIFVLFDADGLTPFKEKRAKSTVMQHFEAGSDNSHYPRV